MKTIYIYVLIDAHIYLIRKYIYIYIYICNGITTIYIYITSDVNDAELFDAELFDAYPSLSFSEKKRARAEMRL